MISAYCFRYCVLWQKKKNCQNTTGDTYSMILTYCFCYFVLWQKKNYKNTTGDTYSMISTYCFRYCVLCERAEYIYKFSSILYIVENLFWSYCRCKDSYWHLPCQRRSDRRNTQKRNTCLELRKYNTTIQKRVNNNKKK